jgi:hypothetical protein
MDLVSINSPPLHVAPLFFWETAEGIGEELQQGVLGVHGVHGVSSLPHMLQEPGAANSSSNRQGQARSSSSGNVQFAGGTSSKRSNSSGNISSGNMNIDGVDGGSSSMQQRSSVETNGYAPSPTGSLAESVASSSGSSHGSFGMPSPSKSPNAAKSLLMWGNRNAAKHQQQMLEQQLLLPPPAQQLQQQHQQHQQQKRHRKYILPYWVYSSYHYTLDSAEEGLRRTFEPLPLHTAKQVRMESMHRPLHMSKQLQCRPTNAATCSSSRHSRSCRRRSSSLERTTDAIASGTVGSIPRALWLLLYHPDQRAIDGEFNDYGDTAIELMEPPASLGVLLQERLSSGTASFQAEPIQLLHPELAASASPMTTVSTRSLVSGGGSSAREKERARKHAADAQRKYDANVFKPSSVRQRQAAASAAAGSHDGAATGLAGTISRLRSNSDSDNNRPKTTRYESPLLTKSPRSPQRNQRRLANNPSFEKLHLDSPPTQQRPISFEKHTDPGGHTHHPHTTSYPHPLTKLLSLSVGKVLYC